MDMKGYLKQGQRGRNCTGMKKVVSNMAGVVLEFLVKPGEQITVDQDVVMLESMKCRFPSSQR